MMMTRFVRASVLGLAIAAMPGRAAAQGDAEIAWSIAPTGRMAADTRMITFRYPAEGGRTGSTGSARSVDEMAGLDAAALAGPAESPVRFTLAGDPGRLECEGTAGGGRGSGRCAYQPAPGFAGEMERLGAPRPSSADQLELLIHGVELAQMRELRRLGYRDLEPDRLIAMQIFYVTLDFAREATAFGDPDRSLDELVSLKHGGVSLAYLRALREAGYTRLTFRQIEEMHRHRTR
ncbi:hypothetical protein [Longimicrobium sp.]|uniref:hypothetical protein n=1 Tax=Longimicrobium sp. TaxID=2029185 RepID=UPI002C24D460|nr:hypothetical protein [Longimicrobium sp.]HSU13920.1 hypothetical protein [Longimicrobium sp.]